MSTTTTTTTEVETTSTTTLVAPEDKKGEVAIDKSDTAPVVGGPGHSADKDAEIQAKNIEDAKQDGLRNAKGDQDLN